jgi:hypothetical protein
LLNLLAVEQSQIKKENNQGTEQDCSNMRLPSGKT